MPPDTRPELETRTRVLAAAGELFVSEGYLEATVTQIRARAGVSNGSFFHLFKTKAELAEALVADIARSYREEVLSHLLRPARSPEQAIAALLHAHLRWVASDHTRARLWFALRPALVYLGVSRGTRSPAEDALGVVGPWVEPLIAAGEVRPMPVETIAALILGGTEGIGALQAGIGDAGATGTELAKNLAAAAWGAIRAHVRRVERAVDQEGLKLPMPP